MKIDLTVNGECRTLAVEPLRRLLDILREDLKLTGAKEGCGEGECGACAVLLNGSLVNSCLVPALQLDGANVLTVEGLGTMDHPDPVQRAFLDQGAVQCGFCIPGMAMATRALLDRNPKPTRDEIRLGLAGNLCRCTGYERILKAVEAAAAVGESPAIDQRHASATDIWEHGAVPEGLRHAAEAAGSARRGAIAETAVHPAGLDEALAFLNEHQERCTIVAGATDLLTLVKLGTLLPGPLMDISGISGLAGIVEVEGTIEIGAATTFAAILDDPLIAEHLPSLREMASLFGAVAIRNRATLGGNLASASPAADAPPVLAALNAVVVLAGPAGSREIPIASFFVGYRATARRPDELLVGVRIPVPRGGARQVFYKIGTRRAQSISKASLACHARCERDGRLRDVRLAAGSVAPTMVVLARTQTLLEGSRITPDLIGEATRIVSDEISPIDDVRSSRHYRSVVTGRLLSRFLTGFARS